MHDAYLVGDLGGADLSVFAANNDVRFPPGADEGVRALSAPGFATCTLDSPYTIARIPEGQGSSLKAAV